MNKDIKYALISLFVMSVCFVVYGTFLIAKSVYIADKNESELLDQKV